MNRSNHWLHQFICLAAVTLTIYGAGAAQFSVVDEHGPLRVSGNRIVDKNGRPVVLRGMSFFWSQWMGKYYNTNVVQWLRDDWHCTVVRAAMAVEAGGYLTNPEREKEKIKTIVQAAIYAGIYVIIDWHDHNANRHTEQAQAFFEEIAMTYGKYPNVIYELWNEPLRQHDWTTVVKPYHEAVIQKIRAHDSKNLIVCGTPSWSQDVDKASRDPLKLDNVAYTLHFYAGTHRESLRNKAAIALTNGVALMVTEWGTSESSGNGKLDEEEMRRWWEFMDRNQLSWCNWSLADKAETSAALNPGANPLGGWSTNDLSKSGNLVRAESRGKMAQPPATQSSAATTQPTLFIIGDSTVKNGTKGQKGWGEVLPEFFNTTKISLANHAIGGRSSRTFLTEGRWDRIVQILKPGDFVIMQFGHNDGGSLDDPSRARGSIRGTGDETREIDNPITKQKEVVHSYGWYLRKYVQDAKDKGAVPIVCSPIPRNIWKDGKVARASNDYGKWAAEVARTSGAAFLDLNELIAKRYEELGEDKVKDLFFGDHTHTNPDGARINAGIVAEGVKSLPNVSLGQFVPTNPTN